MPRVDFNFDQEKKTLIKACRQTCESNVNSTSPRKFTLLPILVDSGHGARQKIPQGQGPSRAHEGKKKDIKTPKECIIQGHHSLRFKEPVANCYNNKNCHLLPRSPHFSFIPLALSFHSLSFCLFQLSFFHSQARRCNSIYCIPLRRQHSSLWRVVNSTQARSY